MAKSKVKSVKNEIKKMNSSEIIEILEKGDVEIDEGLSAEGYGMCYMLPIDGFSDLLGNFDVVSDEVDKSSGKGYFQKIVYHFKNQNIYILRDLTFYFENIQDDSYIEVFPSKEKQVKISWSTGPEKVVKKTIPKTGFKRPAAKKKVKIVKKSEPRKKVAPKKIIKKPTAKKKTTTKKS